MEAENLKLKKEIINWILSLEDETIISELLDLKNNSEEQRFMVQEKRAVYNQVIDDFDEKFAKGIPHEEMKRRTINYIHSLPWKK